MDSFDYWGRWLDLALTDEYHGAGHDGLHGWVHGMEWHSLICLFIDLVTLLHPHHEYEQCTTNPK